MLRASAHFSMMASSRILPRACAPRMLAPQVAVAGAITTSWCTLNVRVLSLQIYRDKIAADKVDDAVSHSVGRWGRDIRLPLAVRLLGWVGLLRNLRMGSGGHDSDPFPSSSITSLNASLQLLQVNNPRADMLEYVSFWFETKYGLPAVAKDAASKLASIAMHFRKENQYCAWVCARLPLLGHLCPCPGSSHSDNMGRLGLGACAVLVDLMRHSSAVYGIWITRFRKWAATCTFLYFRSCTTFGQTLQTWS